MYQLDQVLSELESGNNSPASNRVKVMQSTRHLNFEPFIRGQTSSYLQTTNQPKLYAFARSLARRVQDVMNNTIRDSERLTLKLHQLSREEERHRSLQVELRRNLSRSRETQRLLQSELDRHESALIEARSLEANLRSEIKCQQTRIKVLINEKHKLLDVMEEHDHMHQETEQQLDQLTRKLVNGGVDNLLRNGRGLHLSDADGRPKEPLAIFRLYIEDFTRNLAHFTLELLELLPSTSENLFDHATVESQLWVSPASLDLARNKAASLLGLSVEQLDRLCGLSHASPDQHPPLSSNGTAGTCGRNSGAGTKNQIDRLRASVNRWYSLLKSALESLNWETSLKQLNGEVFRDLEKLLAMWKEAVRL